MELYRVIQIGEADYGCEELPEGRRSSARSPWRGLRARSWSWKSPTPPWRREASRRETPSCRQPPAWKR